MIAAIYAHKSTWLRPAHSRASRNRRRFETWEGAEEAGRFLERGGRCV